MELNLKIDIPDNKELSENIHKLMRIGVEQCALEWINMVKSIISDISVDTGEFLNSIHYEIIEDGDTFIMNGYDGINYGVFVDKGTVEHFVPFYKYVGGTEKYDVSQPILADWAKRVLGMTEEEMLKQGGLKIKHSGIHSFEKGMLHLESSYQEIFRDIFKSV